MSVRLPQILGIACSLAFGLCGTARLHADDYLNKFKAKQVVDAQKTVADVKGMLDQAQRIRFGVRHDTHDREPAVQEIAHDGMSGLVALTRMRELAPDSDVLVLTAQS